MNYWVFVISDNMYEFKKRVKTKKWPIFNNTSHRKHLEMGDVVMFYKAGRDQGQSFLGTGKISTDLKHPGFNGVIGLPPYAPDTKTQISSRVLRVIQNPSGFELFRPMCNRGLKGFG